MGNGKDALFWLDNWGVCEPPLINSLNLSIPMSACLCHVEDLVSSNGGWNMDHLKNLLPNDMCLRICSEIPPRNSSGVDKVLWKLQSNGEFSVKIAYFFRIKNMPKMPIFPIILKLDVPERVKTLILMLAHNRVPTKELCNTWFGGYAWCEHCSDVVESALHVFRDCPLAVDIWNNFVDHHYLDMFC